MGLSHRGWLSVEDPDWAYPLARDRVVDELVCVFWNVEMNGEFSHWAGGDLVSRVDPYDAALNLDLDDPYQDLGPDGFGSADV